MEWVAKDYNIYTDDFGKPITEQRFRGAIAQVRGGEWQTLRANAHLIAAAPELYETLDHLYELFCNGVFRIPDKHYLAITKAASALLKAEGRESSE